MTTVGQDNFVRRRAPRICWRRTHAGAIKKNGARSKRLYIESGLIVTNLSALAVSGGRRPDAPVGRESVSLIPNSAFAIWSATRKDCAAIVSAGFTAADDGKNDASTTN